MTDVLYADLFVINGKGCVVMGHGKTKACNNYTGRDTKMIMLDSIRLEYDGNVLYGYGDVTMGFMPFNKDKAPKVPISYFIYMQGQNETFGNKIRTISKDEFCKLAAFNIEFTNGEEGMKQFIETISLADTTCISVPWCDSLEAKGALVAQKIM